MIPHIQLNVIRVIQTDDNRACVIPIDITTDPNFDRRCVIAHQAFSRITDRLWCTYQP